MTTLASLFSGGGGWDAGALDVGIRPVFAVEYEAWIARWHARVFGEHVLQASVADVDYRAVARRVGRVGILVSSPPCQATSRSGIAWKTRRKRAGIERAEPAVCDPWVGIYTLNAVDALRPRAVLLENNATYSGSEVFARIVSGLLERGYDVDHKVLRAERYGIPSGRERLIMRASKGRALPPWPTPVPPPSWLAAIEDLIPSLPRDKLAGWQAKALVGNPPPPGVPLLIGGGNVTRNARGYIVFRTPSQAAWTVQLAKNTGGLRVIDEDGVARAMSARAIARLQGFPDWYPIEILPRQEAIHVLGNSVPPVLASALLAPFA